MFAFIDRFHRLYRGYLLVSLCCFLHMSCWRQCVPSGSVTGTQGPAWDGLFFIVCSRFCVGDEVMQLQYRDGYANFPAFEVAAVTLLNFSSYF